MSLVRFLQFREVLDDCIGREARPRCKLFVCDRLEPCRFGRESGSRVVVADKLGLCFELVDVVDGV
jgi:hypothetical protein